MYVIQFTVKVRCKKFSAFSNQGDLLHLVKPSASVRQNCHHGYLLTSLPSVRLTKGIGQGMGVRRSVFDLL